MHLLISLSNFQNGDGNQQNAVLPSKLVATEQQEQGEETRFVSNKTSHEVKACRLISAGQIITVPTEFKFVSFASLTFLSGRFWFNNGRGAQIRAPTSTAVRGRGRAKHKEEGGGGRGRMRKVEEDWGGRRRMEEGRGGRRRVKEGGGGRWRHVGRLSTRRRPPCHRGPRGNGPSNGKVVPHLHNHYRGDRKSFWETINVVLRDL